MNPSRPYERRHPQHAAVDECAAMAPSSWKGVDVGSSGDNVAPGCRTHSPNSREGWGALDNVLLPTATVLGFVIVLSSIIPLAALASRSPAAKVYATY